MFLLQNRYRFLTAVIFIILFTFSAVDAQKKKLTYQQIYQRGSPQLLGPLPRLQGWLDDSNYLELNSERGSGANLTKVNAATGESSIFLDYKFWNEQLPEGFNLERSDARTDDYARFLFNKDNDLYYFSTGEELFKKLTNDKGEEKNPTFSPNGKYVAYTKDNNLFVVSAEYEKEIKLTEDGSDLIYNGWASWVYYEEILGRRSRYAAFWWSPNCEMLAFLRFDDSPVPEFYIVSADGVHGELEKQRYPKAGDPNPRVKLGIANIKDGKIIWIDIDENEDHYVAWPFWTPDSKELFFQWMNRGQDNINIYAADPLTGKKREIYNELQSSWVEFFEDLYFFKNGSGFLLRSNVDGWPHLYYYSLDGKLKKKLTQGEWGVDNITLVDEKNHKVYFQGSMKKQTNNYLYQLDLTEGEITQLTKTEGYHSCDVSPEGSFYIDRYSTITNPTKLELYKGNGESVKLLGDQKLPIMDEYNLGKVEMFTIPSGDGFDLPASWILPPDFDESIKYPVLFNVYGGPGTASVRNSFPWYLSSYYLAQNGIIVIAVDNRGSGHFGKKGSSMMHRNLGKWEMHDLIAAVKWLREKPFIDETKIGITGGSYGGYTTCMALTYGADYFTHGIAQYSVTDWKLYDNVYTERYMDTPAENPDGYEFGSALTHADKYKGHLLITHGTMDDNVHMQNTIQLVDKLQDLQSRISAALEHL